MGTHNGCKLPLIVTIYGSLTLSNLKQNFKNPTLCYQAQLELARIIGLGLACCLSDYCY
jgi:hypothetical protein